MPIQQWYPSIRIMKKSEILQYVVNDGWKALWKSQKNIEWKIILNNIEIIQITNEKKITILIFELTILIFRDFFD